MSGLVERQALGVDCTLVVTDVDALDAAARLLDHRLVELDRVASRFRPDSEVSRLAALPGDATGQVTHELSPLLAELLCGALWAARATDGVVDPTLGRALEAVGYDTDFTAVRARAAHAERAPVAGVVDRLSLVGRRLTMPAGTLLDLGSTGKAGSADRIARELAQTLPGGFLVDLGGDIAVAGPAPVGGWVVRVADGGRISIASQGVATSGTDRRRWTTDGGVRHHLLDPRTGRSAGRVWRHVTCLGANALEANAAATAACVLGAAAPGWLIARRIPARLVPERPGAAVICTPGWPVETYGVWAS